jgi:hypothetical protein
MKYYHVNKKPLLISAFLLSFFMVKAQDPDPDYVRSPTDLTTPVQTFKRFSLGVSFGPALPVKDFASTNIKGSIWDFNSPDSTTLRGFAETGFHFDISLSYLITPDFGLIFYYGGNSNSFDIGSFSSAMGYLSTNPSGAYYTAEYLAGPFVNLQLSDKFSIKVNAMIGLVANTYPTLSVNLNDTVSVERTINGGAGFGYSFSACLYYKATESLSLMFNVSYMGSTIFYPGWTETDFIEFPSLGITASASVDHSGAIATMQTGIIKPTIGLELKF